MKRTLVAVAVMTALCSGAAFAQAPSAPAQPAKPAAKAAAPAKAAPAGSSDKQLYSQGQFDLLLKTFFIIIQVRKTTIIQDGLLPRFVSCSKSK